jgi:hypothetical protein
VQQQQQQQQQQSIGRGDLDRRWVVQGKNDCGLVGRRRRAGSAADNGFPLRPDDAGIPTRSSLVVVVFCELGVNTGSADRSSVSSRHAAAAVAAAAVIASAVIRWLAPARRGPAGGPHPSRVGLVCETADDLGSRARLDRPAAALADAEPRPAGRGFGGLLVRFGARFVASRRPGERCLSSCPTGAVVAACL